MQLDAPGATTVLAVIPASTMVLDSVMLESASKNALTSSSTGPVIQPGPTHARTSSPGKEDNHVPAAQVSASLHGTADKTSPIVQKAAHLTKTVDPGQALQAESDLVVCDSTLTAQAALEGTAACKEVGLPTVVHDNPASPKFLNTQTALLASDQESSTAAALALLSATPPPVPADSISASSFVTPGRLEVGKGFLNNSNQVHASVQARDAGPSDKLGLPFPAVHSPTPHSGPAEAVPVVSQVCI